MTEKKTICFASFPLGHATPGIRSAWPHGGITSNHTGRPR